MLGEVAENNNTYFWETYNNRTRSYGGKTNFEWTVIKAVSEMETMELSSEGKESTLLETCNLL